MNVPMPIIQAADNQHFRLVTAYKVEVFQYSIAIEPGYTFDGASIPRVFWRVVGHPLQGLTLPASLVHDILYLAEALPRETSDQVFRCLLIRAGVPGWKVATMYRAVRWFGGYTWRAHTDESIRLHRSYLNLEASP